MRWVRACAGLLLVAGAGAARAEGDACGAFKWPVTREMQAFAAAPATLGTGSAYPAPGTAVTVTLSPQDTVTYTVKPRRPPKSAPSFGAELMGAVPQAGSYQVTLSDEAWIDLVQNGKVLRSTAFSGVVGCPTVRKSVRFDLVAGPVAIAVSDAPAGSLKLDLVPAQ